jgi:hypothetical protein
MYCIRNSVIVCTSVKSYISLQQKFYIHEFLLVKSFLYNSIFFSTCTCISVEARGPEATSLTWVILADETQYGFPYCGPPPTPEGHDLILYEQFLAKKGSFILCFESQTLSSEYMKNIYRLKKIVLLMWLLIVTSFFTPGYLRKKFRHVTLFHCDI